MAQSFGSYRFLNFWLSFKILFAEILELFAKISSPNFFGFGGVTKISEIFYHSIIVVGIFFV